MASLHFKFASMNAGKSAQLLMTAFNYEERNMKVVTIKPRADTRDNAFIFSRALNIRRPVDFLISKEDSILIWLSLLKSKFDVVLVDESQFLTKNQVDELSDVVDIYDIPVICYGLRTDFNGSLFEGSSRLFEIADKFEEFKTICPCCGKKAIINMRLGEQGKPIFNGDQVQAGHNYLPVCRKYYKELKDQYGTQRSI